MRSSALILVVPFLSFSIAGGCAASADPSPPSGSTPNGASGGGETATTGTAEPGRDAGVATEVGVAGTLDPAFAKGGVLVLDTVPTRLTLSSDGSFVTCTDRWFRQVDAKGSLASAKTDVGSCSGLVALPDGKYLVYQAEISGFTRLGASGAVDTSFTPISLGTGEGAILGATFDAAPDGAIVAAGSSVYNGNWFVARRFGSDGKPDTSWGTNGRVSPIEARNFGPSDIALLDDGTAIVVGGAKVYVLSPTGALSIPSDASQGSPSSVGLTAVSSVAVAAGGAYAYIAGRGDANGELAVVRMKMANDTVDTTFGASGLARTGLAKLVLAGGVAVQADGKILVIGSSSASSKNELVIARFLPTGTLDLDFGDKGVSRPIDLGAMSFAPGFVQVAKTGAIYVTGQTYDGSTGQGTKGLVVRIRP